METSGTLHIMEGQTQQRKAPTPASPSNRVHPYPTACRKPQDVWTYRRTGSHKPNCPHRVFLHRPTQCPRPPGLCNLDWPIFSLTISSELSASSTSNTRPALDTLSEPIKGEASGDLPACARKARLLDAMWEEPLMLPGCIDAVDAEGLVGDAAVTCAGSGR